MDMETPRETWAEIDLNAILQNFHEAKKLLKKETMLAAVLKANAYGHGAVKVAELLVGESVDMLAVACLTEAIEIRRKLAEVPILIMGHTSNQHLKTAIENNLTLTIFSLEQAELISTIALELNKTVKIHIKIDTGFNRLGMKPEQDTECIIKRIAALKNLEIEGIFSHLALTSKESDENQYTLFMKLISRLENTGINIPIKHLCDSIGMVRYPEYHMDMVRVGAFLYGARPNGFVDSSVKLETSLTFKTRIAQIKQIEAGEGVGYDFSFIADKTCKVGTLPVGYADGYMRSLSNKGFVSVHGKRARVIGLICMDQCMIDLTDIPESGAADEVILIGGNGADSIPIMEVAELAGTNRNEIMSIINRRVPRVYIKDKKIVDIVDYLVGIDR